MTFEPIGSPFSMFCFWLNEVSFSSFSAGLQLYIITIHRPAMHASHFNSFLTQDMWWRLQTAHALSIFEGEAMLNMMICARTRMHRRLKPDLLLVLGDVNARTPGMHRTHQPIKTRAHQRFLLPFDMVPLITSHYVSFFLYIYIFQSMKFHTPVNHFRNAKWSNKSFKKINHFSTRAVTIWLHEYVVGKR